MKRETAIKGLKAFRKEFSGYEPNEEMFDMAIKALEQEPTTKNDLEVDCISRTSALDSINWAYNLSDAYQKINELPSVIPQEPIIDKIRAEILQLKTKTSFTFVNIDDVLRLIDKHIESEDKE